MKVYVVLDNDSEEFPVVGVFDNLVAAIKAAATSDKYSIEQSKLQSEAE